MVTYMEVFRVGMATGYLVTCAVVLYIAFLWHLFERDFVMKFLLKHDLLGTYERFKQEIKRQNREKVKAFFKRRR